MAIGLKEGYWTKGYWIAALPKANRQMAIDWWEANFPDDPVPRVVRADADTICFRPRDFDILLGFPYNPDDDSQLWVATLSRLRTGIEALGHPDRRLVLPVVSQTSQPRKSFYFFNGGFTVDDYFINDAGAAELVSRLRNDPDPEI